jgi:hypothetical protein
MKKIKELDQLSINKILAFYESTEYKDKDCECWIGICSTVANNNEFFLDEKDYDHLYELKYKYGKRILKHINKLNKDKEKS